MNRPDIDASLASDASLPKSMNIQNLALAAPKGQTAYGNSIGYFTGYDLGGNALRLNPSYFETQKQTLWCWAAVASTLGNFHSGAAAGETVYTQAYLYNYIKGTNCDPPELQAPPYSPCNMPGDSEKAMQKINIWKATYIQRADMSLLLGELYEGRPFVVILNMQVNNTEDWYLHCVVIDAVYVDQNSGYEYWNVCDPTSGVTIQNIQTFPQNYSAGGWGYSSWNETIFSQKPR